MPPASPAATMFTKRSSNAFGCLRIASARDEPASTSCRTARMIFWKSRLSCWLPRISRHCTSGRPASIMTENWRVKIARRRALTLPPPIFGTANSLPFSLTVVTSICRRLRSAIARSFESATRTPPVVPPCRVRPFQTNCAMGPPLLLGLPAPRHVRRGRRDGAARRLRRHDAGAARDHFGQFVGERGDRHRELLRDDAAVHERRERLVEGLHAVLVLPGLHHRVDLVELVLADEVADRGS